MKNNKNQWVVYSGPLWSIGVGLVRKKSRYSCEILYSEKQQYPTETWDNKYCKFFNNIRDAISYYMKSGNDEYTFDEYLELIKDKFPNAIKEAAKEIEVKNNEKQ